ncbi:unnamed protein product [Didymodactylos carnosus]|uniref:Uncharacterized protein n=1 Tax=Didymodactylos carnosus TaxID=1234261 RepID=A0A813UCA0_9BILA|nr:unnamed protein product [Didymodactylos carnosus]CAF0894367.1 unnamed protein product [Didymodactylos carnosus]CAF3610414.1 unnamed protein product [Didymodactylos carnosus]CAF3676108.1 unnamed protein product [Didymodactylos carnosus]
MHATNSSSKVIFQSQSSTTTSDRLCSVCGDMSTGTHFGGNSCESCKAFFRRSVQCTRYTSYKCSCGETCVVNLVTRKVCQYCRYIKCVSIGMKSKWVLSDEEREEKYGSRRKRIRKDCQINEDPDIHKYVRKEEKLLIEDMAHAFYQARATYPLEFPSQSDLSGSISTPSSARTTATTTTTTTTTSTPPNPAANFLTVPIQRLVLFARMLKDFNLFSEDDKVKLLKGSAMEIIVCSSNTLFDPITQKFTNYLSRDQQAAVDNSKLNFDPILIKLWGTELFETTKTYLISMCNLYTDEVSTILLIPIIIFSPDRSNLNDIKLVNQLQIKYSCLLRKYMNWRYGIEQTDQIYPKLLLKIIDIRTLGLQHSEVIRKSMAISNVNPLVQEINVNTIPSIVKTAKEQSQTTTENSKCAQAGSSDTTTNKDRTVQEKRDENDDSMMELDKTYSIYDEIEKNNNSKSSRNKNDLDSTPQQKQSQKIITEDDKATNLRNIWKKKDTLDYKYSLSQTTSLEYDTSICGSDSDNSSPTTNVVISSGNSMDVNRKQESSLQSSFSQDVSRITGGQRQQLTNLMKINDHQVPVLSPNGSAIPRSNSMNSSDVLSDSYYQKANTSHFLPKDQTNVSCVSVNQQDSNSRSLRKYPPLHKANQFNDKFSIKMINDDISSVNVIPPVTATAGCYNKDMLNTQNFYAVQYMSESMQSSHHHHHHQQRQQQHYHYLTARLSSPNSPQQHHEQNLFPPANNHHNKAVHYHKSQLPAHYNPALYYRRDNEEEKVQLLNCINDPYKRDLILKILRKLNQPSNVSNQQKQQNDQFQFQLTQPTAHHYPLSLSTSTVDHHSLPYRPSSQRSDYIAETQYSSSDGIYYPHHCSPTGRSTKSSTRES